MGTGMCSSAEAEGKPLECALDIVAGAAVREVYAFETDPQLRHTAFLLFLAKLIGKCLDREMEMARQGARARNGEQQPKGEPDA